MLKSNKTQGFTLIEILVVVALIAILAAITIIAINPANNFADARNTQRQSDVREILSAITQYTANQQTLASLGTFPTCPTVVPIGTGAGNLNLTTGLVPDYIVAIPLDPLYQTDGSTPASAADTGYTACQTSGRVTIDAPNAERSKTITVVR